MNSPNPIKPTNPYHLLNYFVDLCLLRKGPQDAPFSPALLLLTYLLNIVAGTLLVEDAHRAPIEALLQSTLDSTLLLALLYPILHLQRRQQRFTQMSIALFGSSILLSLVALPLIDPANLDSELADPIALMFILLIFWNLLVMGHILRHGFGVTLAFGFVLAISYNLLSYTVIALLISGA